MDRVAERSENFAPPDVVEIVEIVASEATAPRNDGSRGSELYTVPIKLSREPTEIWRQTFIQFWDRPPWFGFMHRPGIARVEEDRIVLDGTTIEEIEQHHKETLEMAVRAANASEQFYWTRQAEQKPMRDKQLAEHRSHVEDVAKRIKFA